MTRKPSSDTVSWGVLSTALIGREKVLPAMRTGRHVSLDAIASRDIERGRAAAAELGIPKVYGSYEELIADPDIEAIYNPLPNHLHVPWTIKALEAGKHVLCEKPIALDTADAQTLAEVVKRTGRLMSEAFMVRHHPQWQRAQEIARSGELGEVRAIQIAFAYFNDDPGNIRNMADIGGGGIYDIGCYAVTASRYIFGAEPQKVVSLIDRDPALGTDRVASALLAYPGGRQLAFTCATQLVPYQRVQILGTKGRVEIQIPFNAPADAETLLYVDDARDLKGSGIRVETIPACDQYRLQGESFSRSVLGLEPLAYGIDDAIANMRVIDALYRSGHSGTWERP